MSDNLKIKAIKVGKGALIAGIGAGLAYIFQHSTGILGGDYSELMAAGGAIIANFLRVLLQKVEA